MTDGTRSPARWLPFAAGALLLATAAPTAAQERYPPPCREDLPENLHPTSPGPCYIAYDEAPRLLDPGRVHTALDSIYRDWYPKGEVRGEMAVWVRVDRDGDARPVGWADRPETDAVDLGFLIAEALEFARYEPARNRGKRVTVYVQSRFVVPPPDPARAGPR